MQVGTLDELRSHLSSREGIEVVTGEVFEKWQGLKSVKGVNDAELPEPSRVLITLDEDANIDQVTTEVLRYLEDTGIRIRSIKPVSPSLDEIYLRYVGEVKSG
jgi:ABC-type multidrug transport system ATPase subunit